MHPTFYITIIVILIVVFVVLRNRRMIIAKKMIEKRKNGESAKMKELAKKFIDKECLVYSFDSSRQFEGVIKEVTEGALLIEKDDAIEAINLDFVIRIREYPRNKKGKKKSIVLD